MDLIYSLIWLIACGIAIALGVYLWYIYKDKELRVKLKRLKFLFRWWLIGRYHCKADSQVLKLYNALNKIFWGVVTIGICLVIAKIMEGVKWIL